LTDSSGRNSFGSNGKAKQATASNQGHQSGGDGNANVKPDVDFNPAEAKQLDNWVSQVRKDHLLPGWGSAAGASRSIEGAKAHYHPKAGDVANIIENNEAKDVKGAIGAIRSKVADYKQQGLSNSAITDKFSSGEAFNEIAQSEGTELSKNRDNMTTLADFTLRPTSEYSGQQIVSTLGKAINDPTVETPSQVNGFINSQMRTDSNLGSYTGPVRGVVATAREMGVNGAQVENAYAMYSAGNTEGAWSELAAGTNSSPQTIGKMMQQFKAIPSSATMARSTKAIPLPQTVPAPMQPVHQIQQLEMSSVSASDSTSEPPEFPPDLPAMTD